MKKNIIALLINLAICLALVGCMNWSQMNTNPSNSPIKMGTTVEAIGVCKDTFGYPTCTDVSVVNADGESLESVKKTCTTNSQYPHNLDVTILVKPNPLLGESTLIFKCGDDSCKMRLTFSPSVNITPPSTVESMITLSPGQQQQLTVTLPNIESTQIGSKFAILESQQYLSFVGNESSCTINANQSSCSVTVQANSNITTTVNQTLQVVTSEFPTESVFIKIAPSGPKYIFVSQSITAGNFGGFAAADNLCNTDGARTTYPTQLGSGTFKALLNGNNATAIGTEYKNLAGESIATATTTNLVAQDTGLTNPIGKTPSGTQDGQYAWTGLASTTTPASNCVNWTNAAPGQSLPDGTVGYVSVNYASWAVSSSSPTSACWVNNIHLYCVQQ